MNVAATEVDLADALRTVAVNSAYNGSRALSKWFRRGVRLNSEGFSHVPLDEVTRLVASEDSAVAAIHTPLTGELSGDVLLVFPEDVGLSLVDLMTGEEPGTTKSFDEMAQSCLQETANILGSAFTNSLSNWLGLHVEVGTPSFAHDIAQCVVEPLLVSQAQMGDKALISRTEFLMDGRQIEWSFLLLPDADAMRTMQQHCESSEVRRHALQTIAINGAFNASAALSKWLRRGVRLSTQGFTKAPLVEVTLLTQEDEPVVAIHTELTGQLRGHTLLMLSERTARTLVDLLLDRAPGTTLEIADLEGSCLMETANLVSSAFINSWAKWLEIHAEPGPPSLAIDMPAAILSRLLVDQAMVRDEVFMAQTSFSMDGQWLDCAFYVLPSPSSLRLIEIACS